MNKLFKIMLLVISLVGLAGVSVALAGPKGTPVHVVPEPISTSLFILGGAAVGLKSYLNKRSKK